MTTAKSSQRLADALRAAGLETMAKRAEQNEFHDFLSDHALPVMRLMQELHYVVRISTHESTRIAAANIAQRVVDGEFDAGKEESDDWAKSSEGQAAFDELVKSSGKKKH